MKPRIIVIVSGGVVQDIISNGDVGVTILDWDNMEYATSEKDYYEQLKDNYPVTEYDHETFNCEEVSYRNEWDERIDKLIQYEKDNNRSGSY